jgi:pantoate--beta-alanine ligase
MKLFKTIKETSAYIDLKKANNRGIGFVPTMGALHEGHLELMRRAKKENDVLVVSVFVNPKQFDNPEDLKKYPRDLAKDRALLEEVGCDILFAPDVEEMYPEEENQHYDFGPLDTVMEGASRKGHFNGVAIVVRKLFDIVKPHNAYFGEKDFQQLAIIKELVKQTKQPLTIMPCPIVREADGLAMSSRNERLTTQERELAPFIYQTLLRAKDKMSDVNPAWVKAWVKDEFGKKKAFTLDYFEIAEDTYLQPVDSWEDGRGTMGFIAVFLGKVRLIDNIRFI